MFVKWKRRRRASCVLVCCYLVTAHRDRTSVRHDVIAYLAGVSEKAVTCFQSASGQERVQAAEQLCRFWARIERAFSDRVRKRRVAINWHDLRRIIEKKIAFIDERGVRIVRRIAERQAGAAGL